MAAAVLPLLVRIDARRPASWLSCGMAAAAGAALAAMGPDGPSSSAAVACGGWATVAAAGCPPRGVVPGSAAVDAAWWWARAVWPLAGVFAAVACRWLAHGDGGAVATGMLLGILVVTLVAAGAARRAAPAADAVSLGLVIASAAAIGGLTAATAGSAITRAAATAAAIGLAAWLGWRHRARRVWPGLPDEPRDRAPPAEIVLARGGPRAILSAVAMAASLAGMAGWSFLVPEWAPLGCLATLGWFSALAVPAAMIGPTTERAWENVSAASAVSDTRRFAPAWRRPGWLRMAGIAATAHAVILGWPPLVAGLLQTAEATVGPASVVWPWLTVASLAVAATVLVWLVILAGAVGGRRETVLAVAAGFAIATTVFITGFARLRPLPRVPGQTDVEKIARLAR